MNFEELSDAFRGKPCHGRFTRAEFEGFQKGGVGAEQGDVKIVASHNYQCLDAYGPDQRIDLMGVLLSVYVGRRYPVTGIADSPDDIPQVIARLAGEGRKLCEHSYGRHVSNNGNCLNTYECGKCGVHFSVDSSD